MGFNEKVHAYIAAKYFVHLTEQFGERGKRAFVHGTQYYAEQRGRRMAQRAIRDGEELTYAVYQQYGEWVNTEDIKALGCQNKSTVKSFSPDMHIHITDCPLYAQFKEMDLVEGGHTYCEHLDNSICRGFNPYIQYLVPETLHKSGFCTHIIKDVNFPEGASYKKKPEYLQDFEYHCAHSYWSYEEVCGAIFGAAGKEVAAQVLRDFTADYGVEMADTLIRYESENFNVCR